jgi:SAM-dependent methyltransferase
MPDIEGVPEKDCTVAESDAYLLGRSASEQARLSRQISELAPDSDALLDGIGIKPGERVIDIGCGPGGVLDLLAKRVGPSGAVLGIERSPHFVELARRFIHDRGLAQVEVREGDAYDTGLPRASFDGGHMRLVLVNVPEPERIVREMVSLVRPGGWVASFEADYLAHICDPPLPAWTRLVDAFVAYSGSQGIDLFVGFGTPASWTSRSMRSCTSTRSAIVVSRSCGTSSIMFASRWLRASFCRAATSRTTWTTSNAI